MAIHPFVPRLNFQHLSSIPRSYFLGHHAAAIQKMKSMLNSIDLIIECRDYRVPVVSRNPMFEEYLGQKPRLIVHTKHDLGSLGSKLDRERDDRIVAWNQPNETLFSSNIDRSTTNSVLQFCQEHAERISGSQSAALFGTRMMVVGMPNVGKSTLINALRNISLGKKKAARTGDQPGITRKIAVQIKILDANEDRGVAPVYLIDTPGVFVPYVPDPEAMLKLALCGSVKDTVVPPTTIADYLLYHVNLHDSSLYSAYHEPTNDIFDLLGGLARREGRLKKGGDAEYESSALRFIQLWRNGALGKFVLDDVSREALSSAEKLGSASSTSIHQAKRMHKQTLKDRYSRT